MARRLIVKNKKKILMDTILHSLNVCIETLEESIFATSDGLSIGGAVQYRED